MPFRSQAQWKKCFASGGTGWNCRKWAHETPDGKGTRFRALPPKVKKKAYTLDDLELAALKDHDPDRAAAIAETLTLKGTQLAPGVTRIRGDLCNVHGRWGSCRAAGYGGADSPRVKPRALPKAPKAGGGGGKGKGGKGKGGGGAAAKPKLTEEQKRQEADAKKRERDQQRAADKKQREAERRDTRDKVLHDLGIDEGAAEALVMLRNGEQPQPEALARMGAVEAGLVEQAEDGTYRMTGAGRQLLEAAANGDVGRAGAIISGARDRTTARTERQRAAADRKRQAEADRAKKGGGGGKKKPPKPPGPTRRSSAPRQPARSGGGGASAGGQKPEKAAEPVDPKLARAARALSEGTGVDDTTADLLIRNGLAKRNRDGALVLTVAGQRAIRTKSFAVFKDARGQYRWLSRTTTAFEDRDAEVISTKAIADSAQSDAPRGPLRFWHMGRPDPLSADKPWGPGVDLGWCDFAALSGRTLIESGTFKSEAIARAVAAKADQLELSPGFFHAAGEPDASGVFHHIRIFERSLVPKWAGRASNRYTGLVVEKTMDQKKVEALQTLGVDEATIKELLAEVTTTEKAAEADGVRFKEGQPTYIERLKAFLVGEQQATKEDAAPVAEPPAPAPVDPIAELTATVKSLQAELAALKAPPAPVEDGETEVEMMAEGDELMADDVVEESSGDMSWDDVLAGFGQLLDAKLGPLVEALGITTKLDGHMGELKSLLGGYVKTKEAGDAQRADELAAVKATVDQQQAQLAELVGDAPRGGYRPTQAADNTLPALLAATKSDVAAGDDNPFADLIAKLVPGALQQ